jgi:bifunctional UDP-N-acetylglucosamine pyrophosphorylase/glucosamine-1-phosphate N-acetyltransferase
MGGVGAIILAAGKGARLGCRGVNKVMLKLGDKPMVAYTLETLQSIDVEPIIMVVGFAKESIKNYFGDIVLYAEQTKQLGTAHAVACGLKVLPGDVKHVLVVHGDDSFVYPSSLFSRLIRLHQGKDADLTHLTIELDNPFGIGRVIRDSQGRVAEVVEEKVKEVNAGCYVYKREFLEEFLPRVKKNKITGEYYQPDLIGLAVQDNRRIEAMQAGKIPWRGVNTSEELVEARELIRQRMETLIQDLEAI